MIAMLDAPRDISLPKPRTTRDPRAELLQLMVLRKLEDSGPLSGSDALAGLAALVCSLDTATPRYALLHDLRDQGFLSATGERPPGTP